MMKRLGWILTLWAPCLGCNLFDNGTRTLVVEPAQYCRHEDQRRVHNHNEKFGPGSMGTVLRVQPRFRVLTDYFRGFTDGFADYLDAGGNGRRRRYRRGSTGISMVHKRAWTGLPASARGPESRNGADYGSAWLFPPRLA